MKETVNEREALKKAAEKKNASKAKADGKVAKEKAPKAEKKAKVFDVTTFEALKKSPKGTVLEVSGHEGEGRRASATIFEVTDKAVYAEHSKNLLIFRSQKDVDTWKVSLTSEKSTGISFKSDRVKSHFRAHPDSLKDPVLNKLDTFKKIIESLTSAPEAKKAESKG